MSDGNEALPSAFDWNRARIAHRDNLPHLRQENVIYFITFRLADSLPVERVAELKLERERWLRMNPEPHTPQQHREFRRYGACPLRDPDCRSVLEACMRHDDGGKYRMGEFVIMPNHAHALLHVLPGHELSDAMKAWKSVSARRIGKWLGQPGALWMDEYFDHAVRGDEPLEKFAQYIRDNPRHLPGGTFTLGTGTLKTA